jgi:MFS family permease
MTALGMINAATAAWTVPALSRTFALPWDHSSSAMAMATLLSGIFGPIIGGLLADYASRSGGARRAVWSLVLMLGLAVPTGAFSVTSTFMAATVLLTGLLVLTNAAVVVCTVTATTVIPSEARALSLTFASAVGLLCQGFAPVAVSLGAAHFAGNEGLGRSLALVCATLGSAGAVVLFLARHLYPRASGSGDPLIN